MKQNDYVHVECDVRGCQAKLDVPKKDAENYGWLLDAPYTNSRGETAKYDLCFSHKMACNYMRQRQDQEISDFMNNKRK